MDLLALRKRKRKGSLSIDQNVGLMGVRQVRPLLLLCLRPNASVELG